MPLFKCMSKNKMKTLLHPNINDKLPKDWFANGLATVQTEKPQKPKHFDKPEKFKISVEKKFYIELVSLYEDFCILRFNYSNLVNTTNTNEDNQIPINLNSDKWFIDGFNTTNRIHFDSYRITIDKTYLDNLVSIYSIYQKLLLCYNDNIRTIFNKKLFRRRIEFGF